MTPKRQVRAFIFLLKCNAKKLKELNLDKTVKQTKKPCYEEIWFGV